jgi:hypothetical protein
VLLGWALVHALGKTSGAADPAPVAREWLHAWAWDRVLAETFQRLGADPGTAWREVETVDVLVGHAGGFLAAARGRSGVSLVLDAWLADPAARRLLGVNEFEGSWWIGKEACVTLLGWLLAAAEVEAAADPRLDAAARAAAARNGRALAARILRAAQAARYRVEGLLSQMRG